MTGTFQCTEDSMFREFLLKSNFEGVFPKALRGVWLLWTECLGSLQNPDVEILTPNTKIMVLGGEAFGK